MLEYEDSQIAPLKPYLQIFMQCIIDANNELQGIPAGLRAKSRKRSFSTIMNDVVTHNLRANLADFPEVKTRDRYGQLQILFSSEYLMKCKQANSKGTLSYTQTQLALDFINQLQMLPGMPEPITNIILTYIWDRTRTIIERVKVVCPLNKHVNKWEIVISGPMERPMPASPILPIDYNPPSQTKRVVPKKKKVTKIKVRKDNKKNAKQRKTS